MQQPTYIVGIDLGTTNCVVAYANLKQGDTPQFFEIEQLVAAGKVAKRKLLPSFRYHPAEGEIAAQDIALPWHSKPLQGEIPQVIIGEWARELGAKVAGRVIHSAKSWLSHPQVDRSANILPWVSNEDVPKVSPVFASASYLHYIRCAWNHEHPDHPLEQQEVIITVPASFDEAARTLTVEAACIAGLPHILLLEEPQAVCYDWYTRHRQHALEQLRNIKLVLICDIGGGTTDLSLIQVDIQQNELQLKRVGVGDHLMLGGDNIDFALAHLAEKRLHPEGKKLNAANLSQLVQQTRRAKELLLSSTPPEHCKITLLGSGAKLISAAKSTELNRTEVQQIALQGFFPHTALDEHPNKRRSAIIEFGLPYVADPAVSKHIAEFLAQHRQACQAALNGHNNNIPDAILLNGGVFNSAQLSQQIITLFQHWSGNPITQLENTEPNLAVAYGAVGYGLARRGKQLKISGGSARSYFLQLEAEQGVCVLPKGCEANVENMLTPHRFALRLGQPVQFHLRSSSHDTSYALGELCEFTPTHFVSLPPLVAALEGNQKKEVEVSLVATLTEVGTLKLECISATQQRWLVEFALRKTLQHQRGILPSNFETAAEKIREIYGSNKKGFDPKLIKSLRNELEKQLGKREDWSPSLLRALCDIFIENLKKRRRSAQHERLWFNLAGFTLRPGLGVPLDEWRIQQIWPLYQDGLQFPQEASSRTAWCTFWRRAAGGLNSQQQSILFSDLEAFFETNGNDQDAEEIIRLLATLENLGLDQKQILTNWLLKRLKKNPESATLWWGLGRVGSRVPLYSSTHHVLPSKLVQQWLPQLLQQDWKNNPHAAFAAVMIARKSGDRSRDLDESIVQQIIEKLTSSKSPERWITMLNEVTELDAQENLRMFGDELPIGLRLLKN